MWFGHPWEQKITLVGSNIVRLALDLESEFKRIDISYIKK